MWHRRRQLSGFSMVELLISMLFLSVTLFSLLTLASSSNRQSMDAQYEFLALALAREPVEVLRSFGYDWLNEYQAHPLPKFPLGTTQVKDEEVLQHAPYPADAHGFEREIVLSDVAEGAVKGKKIEVRVRPLLQSRVAAWFRRPDDNDVRVEALVFALHP